MTGGWCSHCSEKNARIADLEAGNERLKCCGNCGHRRRYACYADSFTPFHWPEGDCHFTPSRWAERSTT